MFKSTQVAQASPVVELTGHNQHPQHTGRINVLAPTRKLEQTGYQENRKNDPTDRVGDYTTKESEKRDPQ